MPHFADRLADAQLRKGTALCVGLDPRWEMLPLALRKRHDSLEDIAAAIEQFCDIVLDLVAPIAPVVKPQMAFFEACGPAGLAVLQRVLRKASELGLVTILDAKRNDIATTATAYADAAFAGTTIGDRVLPVWKADALTVSPYLGPDTIEPFVTSARRVEAGVFVLVRTSNPKAREFQDLVCDGKPLYRRIGEAAAGWSRANLGERGMGDVGAVVAATYPKDVAELRKLLPEVIFLVPGYGKQGGTAADARAAFRPDGLGAVINSSRGVVFPFEPGDAQWDKRIVAALHAAATELALPSR